MTTPPQRLPWRVVVPVKGGAGAKSRLHPPPGVAREALALALATDCLTACLAGIPATHLIVVTSDPDVETMARRLGTALVADPGVGLNGAVAAGRDWALNEARDVASLQGTSPQAAIPVAALLGDLPSLRPGDLLAALDAAADHDLALVTDAQATGTVLLTARNGAALEPRFGAGSAARHAAAGHVSIALALPRLRTDVDNDQDLAAAVVLGVGPATHAVLHRSAATLPTMQASVHTFDETSGAGSVLLDDGREVPFDAEVFAVSALRHVRPGQRLSIDVGESGRVSKLWIVGIGDDQRIG
ncbi:MAG TPA: 2-phospho-L-lactate guanylyltransferase [Pedococcus sp.]|jgi:2-phospho-L-lactate guanylyltransferase|nr:2-phospho-L-lactate guanylyltransferase [Pedococcus sp.]